MYKGGGKLFSYSQPLKNQSRELLLTHAINSLTESRSQSVMVTDKHFNFICNRFYSNFEQFLKNSYTGNTASIIKQKNIATIGLWDDLYSNSIKDTKSSDLKVLYLSGPEPLNDLDIFLKNGIKPYNVWAIEKEPKEFDLAVEQVKQSNLAIKIHKGSLKTFFETFDEIFDIVYFDACSPIISNSLNPIEVLKELFLNRRINKLSALITNFAEPSKNQITEWSKLLACWFSVRYDNCPSSTNESNFSDINERFFSIEKYANFISENMDEYYGEFIRYFISCMASEIVPYFKTITFPNIQNKLVGDDKKINAVIEKLNNNKIEVKSNFSDIITQLHHHLLSPDSYPLLNWAQQSIKYLEKNHPLVRFLNEGKRTIEHSIFIGDLLKNFEEYQTSLNVSVLEICSDQIKQLLMNLDFFDKDIRITCDLPLKNLLAELLFGQYSFPYLANADSHLSLKYKAKDTTMFSDVFIFDQCRYLYDLLPTVDFFENFFSEIVNQVYIRCCFDGILRNHYYFNSNLFRGAAIEGFHFEGTTMGILKDRINLK